MSTNTMPADDRDPNEGGQPLDEYLLEKAGGLGPGMDWTEMCAHALDTTDCMIATAGTVPDLLHESPMYFLIALRARFALLIDVIDRETERRITNPPEPSPIRDANLSPQLEEHSRTTRDLARVRTMAWLNGIDPNELDRAELIARVKSLRDTEDNGEQAEAA